MLQLARGGRASTLLDQVKHLGDLSDRTDIAGAEFVGFALLWSRWLVLLVRRAALSARLTCNLLSTVVG